MRIDRAGRSDDVRIQDAGIKANGPILHVESAIERQTLLLGQPTSASTGRTLASASLIAPTIFATSCDG